MKRFAATLLALALFVTAFAVAQSEEERPRWADSLQSTHLYTEGIKRFLIEGDTAAAKHLFRKAVEVDSLYAPAYYQLAANRLYDSPEEGITLAERAYRLDTTNKWYHRLYGQSLLVAERYAEAIPLFRSLYESEREPDNYRILAALYERTGQPYSAIAVLDSAEVRFGRIPLLVRMKRQLLASTRQMDRAIEEAQALIDSEPYEVEHHTVLAELYGISGKDSLARQAYNKALDIDSTNLNTLMSLADFFNTRRDYRSMLWATRRLFMLDEMPLEAKIRHFEICTSDLGFYRDNYFQINDLASLLAIRYPTDPRVVKLYADHLIASGELERALAHYKLHTADMPPQEDYFLTIIDIESYLQRPDSVRLYVDRALELFPEKVELHLAGGNVLYRQKRYDEAVRAYKASLQYAATDSLRSVVWGQIGDVYHQQADETAKENQARKWRKKSYEAYETALGYNPDNYLVLNNWAYFLSLEERDLEHALTMIERVATLTDNNPTYMDTHAWVLFKLGRLEEARQLLRKAIALDGQKSMELLVHYGDILDAQGQRFMAETYWKRALDKGYDKAAIEERLNRKPEEKKP